MRTIDQLRRHLAVQIAREKEAGATAYVSVYQTLLIWLDGPSDCHHATQYLAATEFPGKWQLQTAIYCSKCGEQLEAIP